MNDADLASIIKSAATRHEAPPKLRRNVAKALRGEASGHSVHRLKEVAMRGREWLRLGAAFACGLVAAATFVWVQAWNNDLDRLSDEAVADHVRSMMVAHLADVASSDQHTVKPWFNGKLTYSPPVHDLRPQGFPLVGGRLDYLGGHPVAALIYQHRLHTINLFVAPCQGFALGARTQSRQGFNVVEWCTGPMQYWAVSDLNPDELQSFARLLQAMSESS